MKPIVRNRIITLLTILLIDIVAFGCWSLYSEPSSDMAITLIFITPFLFVANLVIGCVMFFIKRYFTLFFVINAFLSPLLFFLFFGLYIRIHSIIYWEHWEFFIGQNKYDISYSPSINKNQFSITYSSEPDSSWAGVENGIGTVIERNDTVYFQAVDSSTYFIHKGYLYNFKNHPKLKVKKKY